MISLKKKQRTYVGMTFPGSLRVCWTRLVSVYRWTPEAVHVGREVCCLVFSSFTKETGRRLVHRAWWGQSQLPGSCRASTGSWPSRFDVPVSGTRIIPGTARDFLGTSYLTINRLTSGTMSLMFYCFFFPTDNLGGTLKYRHTCVHYRMHTPKPHAL